MCYFIIAAEVVCCDLEQIWLVIALSVGGLGVDATTTCYTSFFLSVFPNNPVCFSLKNSTAPRTQQLQVGCCQSASFAFHPQELQKSSEAIWLEVTRMEGNNYVNEWHCTWTKISCVISGIERTIQVHMCPVVRWNVLAVKETVILGYWAVRFPPDWQDVSLACPTFRSSYGFSLHLSNLHLSNSESLYILYILYQSQTQLNLSCTIRFPDIILKLVLLGLIYSFTSEVLVKVDPAEDVMEAERNIKALLRVPNPHNCYNMISEPDILNIQPVGA